MPRKPTPLPLPPPADHQMATQPAESTHAEFMPALADLSMSSVFQSAMTIATAFGEKDFKDLPAALSHLNETTVQIKAGNLAEAESLAATQAVTLDHMFHTLLRRGMANMQSPQGEALLRLALRAQSQSARTLETISALKSPTIFAKQLNVAQRQVVANGSVAQPAASGDFSHAPAPSPTLAAPEQNLVLLAKNSRQPLKAYAVE